LGVSFGARWDILSGFSNGDQVIPTINLGLRGVAAMR
jgi:hypothetical protein